MIETLNNAVILPHLANWTSPVKLRRAWATSVASGINGSEDRASERTAALRKITYKVSTLLGDGPQESEALAERLKAALQSGRAVCPLFGRAQAVQAASAVALESLGLWPWVSGEYAYLSLNSHAGINQEVLVDVGGTGSGAFQPEANFTHTGGSVHTIAEDIDITGVALETVPPQSVLQKYRSVPNDPSPSEPIAFTVQLTTKHHAKARLWFVFESNPGGTFRVTTNGANPVMVDAWAACGSAVLTAGFVDVPCWPDANGRLQIGVTLIDSTFIQVNAIEVFSTCWQMIPIHEVQALDVTTLVFAAEHLKFASLADIEQIYPVLWGKLSIGNMDAITNWNGEIEISVAEPMGDATQGILGLYQTELCGIPIDPTPPVIQELGPLPTETISSEWVTLESVNRPYATALRLLMGEFSDWAAERRGEMIEATGVVYADYEAVPDSAVWMEANTGEASIAYWMLYYYVQSGHKLQMNITGDYAYLDMTYTIETRSQPEEADGITSSGFTAHWTECPGATGYFLDVSAVSDFSTFVDGYENLDVGNALFRAVSGLATATKYYVRLRIYFGTGETQIVSPSSAARAVTTL